MNGKDLKGYAHDLNEVIFCYLPGGTEENQENP
jgi:hypothetical protein